MGTPGRIAIFGNQWITEFLVDAFVEAGLAPALVVNLAPEWAGKGVSGYRDLAERAEACGARLYRPRTYSLKAEEDRAALTAIPIDVCLVFGWQRLLPDWLLDHCRLGGLGIHGGIEMPPRCRGRAGFNWAIILGGRVFHLYVFRLTPRADDGEILKMRDFTITDHDDVLTLYHKNCVLASRMYVEAVREVLAGTARGVPQPREGETFLPARRPENSGVDWRRPAEDVVRLVRAVAPPYPSAFSDFGSTRVLIPQAQIFDPLIPYDAEPGCVVEAFPNGDVVVQAGDTSVYLRGPSVGDGRLLRRGDRLAPVSGEPLPIPVY